MKIYTIMWINLENIMLHYSQTQKVIYCIITFIHRVGEYRDRKSDCKGLVVAMEFLYGKTKIFWSLTQIMVAQHCECTNFTDCLLYLLIYLVALGIEPSLHILGKCSATWATPPALIVDFKMANFMWDEFHLNKDTMKINVKQHFT
jgi:hypothetical protein